MAETPVGWPEPTRDECRSAGYVVTVFPDGPNKGAPACRYKDAAGSFRYMKINTTWGEKVSTWIEGAQDQAWMAAGAAVDVRDDVRAAIAPEGRGLEGVASRLLGLDLRVVFVAVFVLAFYAIHTGQLGRGRR